jgi:hypothetical protein
MPRQTAAPQPEVGAAVAALEAATDRVEQAEAELSEAKAFLFHLKTQVVPEVLNRYGVRSVTTPTGATVSLTTLIFGSLPNAAEHPAEHEAGITWLLEHGEQDAIKSKVVASWGMGERANALHAYETLRGDNSAEVKMDEGIHFATLQAIVRRRLLAGESVPLDTLGITVAAGVKMTRRRSESTAPTQEATNES